MALVFGFWLENLNMQLQRLIGIWLDDLMQIDPSCYENYRGRSKCKNQKQSGNKTLWTIFGQFPKTGSNAEDPLNAKLCFAVLAHSYVIVIVLLELQWFDLKLVVMRISCEW